MNPFLKPVGHFVFNKIVNALIVKLIKIIRAQRTSRYLILFIIFGGVFLYLAILFYGIYRSVNSKTGEIIQSVLVNEYERDRVPYKGLVAFLLSDTLWIPTDYDSRYTGTFVHEVRDHFSSLYYKEDSKAKMTADSIELHTNPPDTGVVEQLHFWDKDRSFYGTLPVSSLSGILPGRITRVEAVRKRQDEVKQRLGFACFVGKALSELVKKENKIYDRKCIQAYFCIDNGIFVVARSGESDQPRYYKKKFPEIIFLPDRPHFRQTISRQDADKLKNQRVKPFFSKEYLDIAGCGWMHTLAMNLDQLFKGVELESDMPRGVVYFDIDLNGPRLAKIRNLLSGLGLFVYEVNAKDVTGDTIMTPMNELVKQDSTRPSLLWLQKCLRVAEPRTYDEDIKLEKVIPVIKNNIKKELGYVTEDTTELRDRTKETLLTDINAYHDSEEGICHFLIPVSSTSMEGELQSEMMTSILYLPVNIGKLQERTSRSGTYFVVFLALSILSFTLTFLWSVFTLYGDRIALTAARSNFIKNTKIAFLILDEHGKIKYHNRKATEIFNVEELKKYDFADAIEKQYKGFHKRLLEKRAKGEYWSPYTIEFDKDKRTLKDSYMERHGNRICIVGGPAELFASRGLTKSNGEGLRPSTLGLVLSMDKVVDILQARRVVLLHAKGFFEEKFVLFQKKYTEQNGQQALFLNTAEYREEDLLILPKTRLLIERADFLMIGYEEKNHPDRGLLHYAFLPELGLGLSNEDLKVYIIVKGGEKESQLLDSRIELFRLDSTETNDFDDFMRRKIIPRIERRSKELADKYWHKLSS